MSDRHESEPNNVDSANVPLLPLPTKTTKKKNKKINNVNDMGAEITQETIVIGKEKERPSANVDNRLSKRFQPLTVAFFLALGGGIIAEIFGNIVVASLIMIFYLAYGLSRPQSERNSEKFADSLYYLGFILTLFALFLALSPIFGRAGQLTSKNIIENFGIAILTTFIGMAARIILIQMRDTATDQEEEARESIARYVVKLNDEIGTTIKSIQDFRDKEIRATADTTKQFAEEIEKIRSTAGSAAKSTGEELTESVRQITARLNDSVQEIIGRLHRLDIPTDFLTSRLSGATASLSGELDKIRSSLQKETGAFSSLFAASAEIMKKLEGSLEEIRKAVNDASMNISVNSKMTIEAIEKTKMLSETMSEATGAMERFKAEAAEFAKMLTALNARLEQKSELFTADIENSVKTLNATARDFKKSAEAYTGAMVDSANVLKEAIRDVENKI